LSGKQLELLKEIVSKLSRVAVFGTSTDRSSSQSLREVERTAPAFGVKLHYHDVTDRKDYESAFQAASQERADAILVRVWGPVITPHAKEFAELAVKNRLPAIFLTDDTSKPGVL